MQDIKRHVLIFDKPPAVKSVLEELSVGIQFDSSIRREIRRGLEEFAKHGNVRLVLDLQVIEPSFERPPDTIKNFTAFVAGEVLIITGQVSSHWMLRIVRAEAESRQHFFAERLMTGVRALIAKAVVEVEIGARLIAAPIRRARAIRSRARA